MSYHALERFGIQLEEESLHTLVMRVALLLCTLVFSGCHRTVVGECSLIRADGSPAPRSHVNIQVLSEHDGMAVMMEAVAAAMIAWKEHIEDRKAISARLELIDLRIAQLDKLDRSAGEAEVISEELGVLARERERQAAALVARYEENAEATFQAYLATVRRSVSKREVGTITDATGRFSVGIARFGKSALFALGRDGQVWVGWTTPGASRISLGQKQLLAKGQIVSSVATLVYATESAEKNDPKTNAGTSLSPSKSGKISSH